MAGRAGRGSPFVRPFLMGFTRKRAQRSKGGGRGAGLVVVSGLPRRGPRPAACGWVRVLEGSLVGWLAGGPVARVLDRWVSGALAHGAGSAVPAAAYEREAGGRRGLEVGPGFSAAGDTAGAGRSLRAAAVGFAASSVVHLGSSERGF